MPWRPIYPLAPLETEHGGENLSWRGGRDESSSWWTACSKPCLQALIKTETQWNINSFSCSGNGCRLDSIVLEVLSKRNDPVILQNVSARCKCQVWALPSISPSQNKTPAGTLNWDAKTYSLILSPMLQCPGALSKLTGGHLVFALVGQAAKWLSAINRHPPILQFPWIWVFFFRKHYIYKLCI